MLTRLLAWLRSLFTRKPDWSSMDYGTPATDPDEQRKRMNGEV